MPPQRWLENLEPEPERLGKALERLRVAAGKTQKEVEQDLEQAGTPLGVQSTLSRYETDVREPKLREIDILAAYYGVPASMLEQIKSRHERWENQQKPLPGPSVAIPQEPELIEAVRALFLLETHDLANAARVIRTLAEGPLPRERDDEREAAS